jgi:muramoyltetrapeptide carboxypeptidase
MPISSKRTPAMLKQGDTIGIVAPARKVSREEMKVAFDLITSWGLNIKEGKHLFGASDQFSGSDEERASDMQDMLNDQEVKAVISARGGYGCLRIIDRLDFSTFLKTPKWLVGYSDMTVFHSHLHLLGTETIHGTMPINFGKDAVSTESLRALLFGEPVNYSWDSSPFSRQGKAEGELVGGNLSLLYALSASKSDIDTKGKILFLEDLDEYLYHVDRMMLNLKRSGKLAGLRGLLIGGMTEMKDNAIPFGKTAEEIILDAVKEYEFPVAFGFPAGHTDRNLAIRLGRKMTLDVQPHQQILLPC